MYQIKNINMLYMYRQSFGYIFAKENPDKNQTNWLSQDVIDILQCGNQSGLSYVKIDNFSDVIEDVKQLFDINISSQSNTRIMALIINELTNPDHKSMDKFGWQYALLGGFIAVVDNEIISEQVKNLYKINKK